MEIITLLFYVVIVVLLIIHYFWVDKRIKEISIFVDQFKHASEGYEKFYKVYSQILKDLERDNQRQKTKYDALAEQQSKAAQLLGTIDPDEIPTKLKSLLSTFKEFMNETDILIKNREAYIEKQEQRIKELESEYIHVKLPART